MKRSPSGSGMPFPYVFDETQEVARAYGAVCTPDFFGFDRDAAGLPRPPRQLRGAPPIRLRSASCFDAMVEIARTGKGPATKHPSIGCSIKWRGE